MTGKTNNRTAGPAASRILSGRVWVFGDDVDTDVIVPGVYLTGGADLAAKHVMEAVRPDFSAMVQPGDIVVGGRNFGSGSSREMAVVALKTVGVAAVVAKSFARIFFRNSINLGFPPVECPTADSITEGQHVEIDVGAGTVRVVETGEVLQAASLSPDVRQILDYGGMENFLAHRVGR